MFNIDTLKLIISRQFDTVPDTAFDGANALDLYKQRAAKFSNPTCSN